MTDDVERAGDLRARFERQLPGVPLVIVESPYRSLVRPLVRFLEEGPRAPATTSSSSCCPSTSRAMVERFLYNENGRRIQEALLGRPNILVAEVPYRRAA